MTNFGLNLFIIHMTEWNTQSNVIFRTDKTKRARLINVAMMRCHVINYKILKFKIYILIISNH